MDILVVGGTYEGKLCGLKANPGSVDRPGLQPYFSHAAHLGCIKAIALSGRWLVSGSSDETIRIMNIHARKEYGGLFKHEGSITALEFVGTRHLLSAGADGMLCVWRTKDWELLHHMKSQRGWITCVAVHPTGKLAVTGHKTGAVCVWDLLKGHAAYENADNESPVECLRWTPSGLHYAVARGKTITIFDAQKDELIFTLEHAAYVCTLCFYEDNKLAAGGDDKQLTVWDLGDLNARKKKSVQLHTVVVGARLKSLAMVSDAKLLAGATSAGEVYLWDTANAMTEMGKVETFARLTCLAATPAITEKKKAGKKLEPATEPATEPKKKEKRKGDALLSPAAAPPPADKKLKGILKKK
eukprot:TRINITY_DN6938_c0_g1_i1.p1 TRINITY_DN6938_c0_g1~~TRINITY_DN6938_c0_g1_i1.p1  ORF type:complete len:370 (-),score=73.19 TRINITY_DN6938_c0_g1_i1:477-1544(-)